MAASLEDRLSSRSENLVALVKVQQCQQTRKLLESNGVYDSSRSIESFGEGWLAIPVLESLNVSDYPDFRFDRVSRHLKPIKTMTPRETLCLNLRDKMESKGLWTDDLATDIPTHWEIHGDLVLLPSTCFTKSAWNVLGSLLWEIVASTFRVRRVAKRHTIRPDAFRSPQVSLLLGSDGWVEHTDNGIRYTFDVQKCMFSKGNINEKLRISRMDCTDQTVVDLYAGIGYFTLPYLIHAKAALVHACEWNPDAVEALKRNLILNGVEAKCTIHVGDCKQAGIIDVADHVNLGLIPSSEDGWSAACRALRRDTGGVLHVHGNVDVKAEAATADVNEGRDASCGTAEVTKDEVDRKCIVESAWRKWAENVRNSIEEQIKQFHSSRWSVTIAAINRVKSYAANVDHMVVDIECRP